MHTVYTLYSPAYEKIYIGRSGNFENRLISHNQKATKGWTVKYRPWKVVFTENYEKKKEAMQREKQLKTARGRAYGTYSDTTKKPMPSGMVNIVRGCPKRVSF